MKIRIAFIIITLATLFSTCTYDVYNADVCFQENILPIFVTKCSMSGCHDSIDHKGKYVFTSYEGIMAGVTAHHPLESRIYNSVRGSNPSMPKGGKLTQLEVSYIKIWIRMGAVNSSNCSSCDTSAFTFSGRIQPLFTNWCVGCHNANDPSGGYNFTSYSGVKTSITNGRLLGSLEQKAGFYPMPQNSPKLSDCDISAVTKWVNAGYPDN